MRDITLTDTFYQCFSTRAFATGIPTTLAGTPVVSAYENDSLIQITAGITLTVDFDGVAGLHLLTVVATGANGYEAGKDYALVITTGTVGGVSVVGEVVAEFTIERSAASVDLDNTTDGLTAIKAVIPAALVGGRMDSSVGAMAADVVTAAALNADAVDEIWDEAMTEVSQAAPSATPAMRALLAVLYMNARNAKTVTATSKTYSNDAGTVVYKSALTDNGTTYAEAELVTGP